MYPLAVATGNAFILKPASPTPSASLLTAELYKEAGLPDGVFNVLSGGTAAVFRTSWFTRVSTLFRLLVRRQWLTLSKTPA